MDKELLITYTIELAKRADKSEPKEYAEGLIVRLLDCHGLLSEYEYYLNTGKFLCEYKIAGYTIADIIIYQMDNFKALLDNQIAQNKNNQYRMVLGALETMLEMELDPEPYVSKMQYTTGTDSANPG